MINDALDIKSALEYYILAGVDETVGDDPFNLSVEKEKKDATLGKTVRRATTDLAQDTVDASKTAREICDKANSLEELREAVDKFEGCSLKLTAANTVFGDGNKQARVMLIGEAPGAEEDREGLPFVGRSGKLLDKMMAAIGLDRDSYYITNILPWRPPGNRTPLISEVAVCLPFLKKQIDLISPDVIFILGGSAANSLLDNAEPISKLRGKWLEYKASNGKKIEVLASFHPAYLLRNPAQKAKAWADLLRLSKKLVQ